MNGCETEWKKTLEGGGREWGGRGGRGEEGRGAREGERETKISPVYGPAMNQVQVEKKLWTMEGLPYLLYCLH